MTGLGPVGVGCGAAVLLVAGLVRAGLHAAQSASTTRRLSGLAAWRQGPGRRRDLLADMADTLPAPPPLVRSALAGADVAVDHRVAWAGWVVAVTVSGLGALAVGGAALGGLVLVAATVIPVAGLRARRGRAGERVQRALPAALEAVARSLRSGASLRQAVAESASETHGPLGHDLRLIAAEVRHGAPLISALEGLGGRWPLPAVRLAVGALCLGVEAGGAQARAVDAVASTLRERAALAAEVRALASQARISALVIGLAPVAFGAFAASADPQLADFVFRTPAGLAILVAGLLLDGLGWFWMNRMARVRV